MSKIQTVFFTSVDPMNKEHEDPEEINLNAPRLAWYKQKVWKKHQNTVYWIDIKFAQKTGLQFYQTRSNAIIFYNLLPAYCIPKAIKMETGEIIHEKVYESPRLPSKISLRHDWMKELGSEVAGGSEDSQQTQPKTKNPIIKNGETCFVRAKIPFVQEIENVLNVTAAAPMKEHGEMFSSCVPSSVKRSDQDKDADENVDADHDRTGRPVNEQPHGLFTQCEDRHRLQGVWIGTCSCETSRNISRSRTLEEDRESPASTSSSSCFKTKQHLQPI